MYKYISQHELKRYMYNSMNIFLQDSEKINEKKKKNGKKIYKLLFFGNFFFILSSATDDRGDFIHHHSDYSPLSQ